MTAPSIASNEAVLLDAIAGAVGTPFYVYSAAALRARCAALMQALPSVDFFYSLKANPNLSVVQVVVGCGFGCEVSSRLELETALAAGALPARILAVGPGKSAPELRRATSLGIKAIVAESADEIVEIDALAGAFSTRQGVALRINPDFQVSGAQLTMGGRPTQFGIDQAELPAVIARVSSLRHVRLCGLHVYMGSRILESETVARNTRAILRLAGDVQALLPVPLDFVDVGGGFGTAYHEGETEFDLAALAAALDADLAAFRGKHSRTRIVVELGRYIAAGAGQFVTEIRRTKACKGERFAVCDGGANVHSAAAAPGSFLRRNFPITVLPRTTPAAEADDGEWTLSGPLCTPMDVIGKSLRLPAPQPGDLVCIAQSGAYGPTASPVDFLGFGAPAEVMVDGDDVVLVRRRGSAEESLDAQTPRPVALHPPRTSGAAGAAGAAAWPPGAPFGHPALEQLAALAPLFSRAGQKLDTDPDAWRDLWADPLVRTLTTIGVPDMFNGFPLAATGLGLTHCPYSLHVAIIERLARLDASCILALPGPSLAGGAVQATGTPGQIERFFRAYLHGPQATFFGVTEPTAGSDVFRGTTTLTHRAAGAVLSGSKMLVGGAKRADIGLVFCHVQNSNSTALVMVEPHSAPAEVNIIRIPTVGLRGVDLCHITITDLPVAPEMILGAGARSLRDGFMAINGVFERNRPIVAALSLGTGRGILDRLAQHGALGAPFEDLLLSHAALLRRLAVVVTAIENGRPRIHDISQIKLQAVVFVDAVVARVFAHAASALFQDAELRRRCRDAKAFEYMEGTSNIHTLNAFRSYTSGATQ